MKMNENASRPLRRPFYCLVTVLAAVLLGRAAGPQKTTISDTLYRADGSPATGTLVISWPAFTTAEAISNKTIVDDAKFRDGLSKVIDGVVACLNASVWAKTQ